MTELRVLNDEEIYQAIEGIGGEHFRRVATAGAQHQADLKAFIEWGDEMCEDRSHTRIDCSDWYGDYKRYCTDCVESLKQLVEGK